MTATERPDWFKRIASRGRVSPPPHTESNVFTEAIDRHADLRAYAESAAEYIRNADAVQHRMAHEIEALRRENDDLRAMIETQRRENRLVGGFATSLRTRLAIITEVIAKAEEESRQFGIAEAAKAEAMETDDVVDDDAGEIAAMIVQANPRPQPGGFEPTARLPTNEFRPRAVNR